MSTDVPTKEAAAFAKAHAEALRAGLKANGWTSLGKVSGRMMEEWTAKFFDHWQAQATAKVKAEKNAPKLIPMDRAMVDRLNLVLAELAGYNIPEMGEAIKKATAMALNEIRRATPKVTEAEIRARAARYSRTWPGLRFTPPGLAKHWAACGGPAPKAAPAAVAECPGWRELIADTAYGPGGAFEHTGGWETLNRSAQDEAWRRSRGERK